MRFKPHEMGPFEGLDLPPNTPIYGWVAAKPLTMSKSTLDYPPTMCALKFYNQLLVVRKLRCGEDCYSLLVY